MLALSAKRATHAARAVAAAAPTSCHRALLVLLREQLLLLGSDAHLARLLPLAQHAHAEQAVRRRVLLLAKADAVGELPHLRHAVPLLHLAQPATAAPLARRLGRHRQRPGRLGRRRLLQLGRLDLRRDPRRHAACEVRARGALMRGVRGARGAWTPKPADAQERHPTPVQARRGCPSRNGQGCRGRPARTSTSSLKR
eukprot:684208-Prymnesium_polylepis.1